MMKEQVKSKESELDNVLKVCQTQNSVYVDDDNKSVGEMIRHSLRVSKRT